MDELGKINEWVSDDRRNLEAPGIGPVLLQLRVLIGVVILSFASKSDI